MISANVSVFSIGKAVGRGGGVNPYANVEYLVVAGGGGGGSSRGGGGGAGGYLARTVALVAGTSYTITVGAGGNYDGSGNASDTTLEGNLGGLSYAFSGGRGANNAQTALGTGSSPFFGSGGGGSANYTSGGVGYTTGNQGFNGGNGRNPYASGGGGGAGAVGNPAIVKDAGDGGDGLTWLDGITRAGGGGGAYNTSFSGTNGSGGAGGGANALSSAPANKGGGGGGHFGGGGSGVVIIRYLGAQVGTGGTVTSAGGYTYHTFNSSGIFAA